MPSLPQSHKDAVAFGRVLFIRIKNVVLKSLRVFVKLFGIIRNETKIKFVNRQHGKV